MSDESNTMNPMRYETIAVSVGAAEGGCTALG